MSEQPEKAEGAHPAPDGHSGGDDPWPGDPVDEALWSRFERPAGYRGHSSTPMEPPTEPVVGAVDADATHRSDPYDYGVPRSAAEEGGSVTPTGDRPPHPADPAATRPAPEPSHPPMPPLDDADDGPVLDRELLARELAADRARSARPPIEPTSEVPRTPADWPGGGPGSAGAHLHRPGPGLLPPGQDGEPRRLLAATTTAMAQQSMTATGEHRPVVPFTPSGSFPVTEAEKLERVFDVAYRWRTLLALGLASVLTLAGVLAFVLAYRPGDDDGSTGADELAGPGGESEIDDVTDFPSATGTVTVDPRGSQDVGSAVDGVETTTTTAATASSSSRSTSGVGDGDQSGTTATTRRTDPAPDTTATAAPTSQPATSAPATSTTTTAPPQDVTFQAEDLDITAPARARSDHEGYTGTGFVGDIIQVGAGAGRTVRSLSSGTMRYTVRYASPEPPNGPEGTRTLSLEVDGLRAVTVSFPPSGGVTAWTTVTGTFELVEGDHTIALVMGDGDTGWVNIDSLTLSSV